MYTYIHSVIHMIIYYMFMAVFVFLVHIARIRPTLQAARNGRV